VKISVGVIEYGYVRGGRTQLYQQEVSLTPRAVAWSGV